MSGMSEVFLNVCDVTLPGRLMAMEEFATPYGVEATLAGDCRCAEMVMVGVEITVGAWPGTAPISAPCESNDVVNVAVEAMAAAWSIESCTLEALFCVSDDVTEDDATTELDTILSTANAKLLGNGVELVDTACVTMSLANDDAVVVLEALTAEVGPATILDTIMADCVKLAEVVTPDELNMVMAKVKADSRMACCWMLAAVELLAVAADARIPINGPTNWAAAFKSPPC